MLELDDRKQNIQALEAASFKPVVRVDDRTNTVSNVPICDFISKRTNKLGLLDISCDPPIASTDFVAKYNIGGESWLRIADKAHTVPIIGESKFMVRTAAKDRNLSRGFIIESIKVPENIGLVAFVPWYGNTPKVYGWYQLYKHEGKSTRRFFKADKCDGKDPVVYPVKIPEPIDNVTQANVVIMNTFRKLRSENVTYNHMFEILQRMNGLLEESIDPPYMLKVMTTVATACYGIDY